MNVNALWLLKNVAALLSALSCACMAFIALWGAYQDERHETTWEWLTAMWQDINDSPWLTLPERAVHLLLEAKERAVAWLVRVFVGGSDGILRVGFGLILFAVVWAEWGLLWAVVGVFVYVAGLFGLSLFMVYGAAPRWALYGPGKRPSGNSFWCPCPWCFSSVWILSSAFWVSRLGPS
jgi:hypothetical protein